MPGSPLDERHRGTNQLIKDGAVLIEDAADVRAVIDPLIMRRERVAPALPRPTEHAQPPPPALPSELSASTSPAAGGLVAQVLACLGAEPLAVDDLVRQCQATTAQIHETLLELELEGRLERHGGNRVSLLFA